MFIQQKIFYRMNGLRKPMHLLTPKVFPIGNFPRNTLFHYYNTDVTDEELEATVDPSKLYFQGYDKKIEISYVTDLVSTLGNPMRKPGIVRPLITPWHRKNKGKFRLAPGPYWDNTMPLTLVVINYNFINKFYRYVPTPMANYHRWYNTQSTIWSTVNEACTKTERNQYIFVDLPRDIPSRSMLEIFKLREGPILVKTLETPERFFFLELWKWLDEDLRGKSLLSVIDEKNYNKINILFRNRQGLCSLLNLGYLDSWIVGHKNQTELDNVQQFSNKQLKMFFLKFVMMVNIENGFVPDVVPESTDTSDDTPEQDETEEVEAAMRKELQEEADDNYDAEPVEPLASVDDFDLQEEQFYFNTPKKGKEAKREGKMQTTDTIDLDAIDDMDTGGIKNFADIVKDIEKDLEKDLEQLENIEAEKNRAKGVYIDKKSKEIKLIEPQFDLKEEDFPTLVAAVYEDKTSKEMLKQQIDTQADIGGFTAAQYRTAIKDLEAYANLPNPYDKKKKIVDSIKVSKEDIDIKNKDINNEAPDTVSDKTMFASTLKSFDRDYIKNVMQKDVIGAVDNIQKAGIIIKDYNIEEESSVLGTYEHHTLELKPINGAASTIHFRLPKVNEYGEFKVANTKYTLRKQRTDVPIRKINPYTTALTSYYGKTFVAIDQKKVNSSLDWIIRQINIKEVTEDSSISNVATMSVLDSSFKAPYIYNALASNYKGFKVGPYNFNFSHKDRETLVPPELLVILEQDDRRACGLTDKKEPIVVTKNDIFAVYRNKTLEPIGDIYQVLGLPQEKSPVDIATLKVFGKTLPIGFILGYYLGFKGLLTLLKATYRTVEARKQRNLLPHEYAVIFNDMSYIFDRREKRNALIINGFNDFEKQIRRFSSTDFNNKDVYFNVLEANGYGIIYIRELELMDQMFVDPITREILEEMKEPITFKGLLIRGTELLESYDSPVSQDFTAMRIRGYERFPGMVYKELVGAIRQYKGKNLSGKAKIDISPYQVWKSILDDPGVKIVEDINPIENLKEQEILTYVGEGGRSKESMNKPTREYHPTDIGVVSEATVDSSEVGINTYLSANPNIKNMRGLVEVNSKKDAANLLSTSIMLAPGGVRDDPKRANFVSIQNSHTVPVENYRPAMVRTGYEYMIGNRTGELFCYSAPQDGTVTKITKDGVMVTFTDGTTKGLPVGVEYGHAAGSIYPHEIKPLLKEGEKFKRGDIITYNTGFFEPDIYHKNRVVYKTGIVIKTAFSETNQTLEDGSAISRRIASKLHAKVTHIRNFTVDFVQNVRNIKPAGTQVTPLDTLLYIEDEITSGTGNIDDESLDILKKFSKLGPSSKYKGTITKIEVYYNGDKSDMSPTLKALADKSDRELAAKCKDTGKQVLTGRVTSEYRVDGTPLALDKAEIKFYITTDTPMGVGDKGIFANQMKSVIGEVMSYDVHTESGTEVDAIFSYRGVLKRMVTSIELIGTCTTLLKVIADKAVKIYEG